jgi:hypothetical protein
MAKNTLIALLLLLCGYSFWSSNESVVISMRNSDYIVQIVTNERFNLHYPFLIVRNLNGVVIYSQELPSEGEDYSWDIFKNIHSITSGRQEVVILLEPRGLYADFEYSDFINSRITLPDGMLIKFELANT